MYEFSTKNIKWIQMNSNYFVAQEILQDIKWVNTFSSSCSVSRQWHVWRQSCDHPWRSPGGLPASMSQPSGGGKWKGGKGKTTHRAAAPPTLTHSQSKVQFMSIQFIWSFCSFREHESDGIDQLWLKIKKDFKAKETQCWIQHCIKFCEPFHTVLTLLDRASKAILLRVQQLFTAERLLKISESEQNAQQIQIQLLFNYSSINWT